MLNLPSTKSLIIFCSAANNSSFTLAAQELNLTQSAISKQIIALEENLGTRLFNRLPYQVNLTKNGQIYYKSIRKHLNNLNKITNKIKSQNIKDQHLKINISPSFAPWLIDHLAAFNNKFKDFKISLSSLEGCQIENFDKIDIAIGAFKNKPRNCQSQLIAQEKMLLIAHPDINQNQEITIATHSSRPKLINKFLSTTNLKNLQIKQGNEFEHFYMIIDVVKKNHAIGLVPDILVKNDIINKNLINLNNISFDSGYKYFITFKKHQYYQDKIQKFVKWLTL